MYPSLFLFRCFGRISGLWWVNRVFFCTLKKKNPLKTKVSKVLRRASTNSSVPEGKHQEAKVSADAGAPLNLPWTNMAALMAFFSFQTHNRTIPVRKARKTLSVGGLR